MRTRQVDPARITLCIKCIFYMFIRSCSSLSRHGNISERVFANLKSRMCCADNGTRMILYILYIDEIWWATCVQEILIYVTVLLTFIRLSILCINGYYQATDLNNLNDKIFWEIVHLKIKLVFKNGLFFIDLIEDTMDQPLIYETAMLKT